MVYPLKMVIFHGYVKYYNQMVIVLMATAENPFTY